MPRLGLRAYKGRALVSRDPPHRPLSQGTRNAAASTCIALLPRGPPCALRATTRRPRPIAAACLFAKPRLWAISIGAAGGSTPSPTCRRPFARAPLAAGAARPLLHVRVRPRYSSSPERAPPPAVSCRFVAAVTRIANPRPPRRSLRRAEAVSPALVAPPSPDTAVSPRAAVRGAAPALVAAGQFQVIPRTPVDGEFHKRDYLFLLSLFPSHHGLSCI